MSVLWQLRLKSALTKGGHTHHHPAGYSDSGDSEEDDYSDSDGGGGGGGGFGFGGGASFAPTCIQCLTPGMMGS